MRFCAIALAVLVFAAPLFAADVDGKWTGSIPTPNGDFQQSFTFKAEGTKLTGSLSIMGMETPISDGKIDGNNISFSITLDFGGMAFTLSYTGIVSPDEIKLSGDAGGMPFQLVVKKVK
jgi:hypothetical protein